MGVGSVDEITQLVVAFASVGSLIAVAWQLRSLAHQTKEAARQAQAATEATQAAVSMAATQLLVNVDQYFANNPEVRRTIYGPITSGPDDLEAQRAEAAAEMLVDMFEGATTNARHLTQGLTQTWHVYIGHMMRSPAARGYWRKYRNWYDQDVQQAIDPWVPDEPATVPQAR